MQLGDGEMIEVEFRDDDAALIAAGLAYENHVMSRSQNWVSRAHEALSCGLAGLGVGLFLGYVAGLEANSAGFFGIMAAIVAWFLGRWHRMALTRKMLAATDTGGWGRIVNRFDPAGFEAVDELRHWRTDWRGVADVALTRHGLAVATKGAVFVLPPGSWDDRAAMRADAAQIQAWWRRATGEPA